MLSALHRIKTYPFDLAAPIFARYPAMKFGDRDSVDGFAGLLAPMALTLIADAPAQAAGWVLTSPPLHGLPCGANLVCRALSDRLAKALPAGQAPQLETIQVGGARLPIGTQAEFALYHEYSKLDLATRRGFHVQRQAGVTYDLANFAGRHALFVNDINVTGTQLGRIESLLRNAGARSLDVLLIVQVEPEIGLAFPQLENEINTSRLAEIRDFVGFLRDCEFEPTGKLIARLLSHDADTLAAILAALSAPKRRLLYRAILQEEIYGGPLFSKKTRIAQHAASA